MGSLRLRVQVEETDAEADRIEGLTLSLRRELLAADVEGVDRVSDGPAPPGTRGLDATTIGSLMVAITSSTLAATQAINTIRGWVSRNSKECKVKISIGDSTLTLSSTPTEQQQHLMTEFLTAVTPTRTGDS